MDFGRTHEKFSSFQKWNGLTQKPVCPNPHEALPGPLQECALPGTGIYVYKSKMTLTLNTYLVPGPVQAFLRGHVYYLVFYWYVCMDMWKSESNLECRYSEATHLVF